MSNFNFSKKVALRYLWSKRSEAFITIVTVFSVIGVAIGVIVLNLTMAIMTGFENELRSKVVGSAHVVVTRAGGKVDGIQSLKEKILKNKEVKSISSFTQHQALISYNSYSQGILLKGIEEGGSAASELSDYLSPGKNLNDLFSSKSKLPPIIIGKELSRSLGMYIKGPVSILSPQVASSPFGLVPRYRRFDVKDIYQSGLSTYEQGLAYTSISAAQKFFRMKDAVSGLEILLHDVDQAPKVAFEIFETLGGAKSGYIVQDWTKLNKELWEAINLEKKAYFIVLLLLIVLASFSIVTSLVMIVLEKRKDIAVMRTLGASARSIARIFRIQGAVIGALGTIFGLIGSYVAGVALQKYGFPLPENVFPTNTLPVNLDLVNFLIVGVSAFAICFLSTIYPAYRASKIKPAEVLRYE